MKIIYWNTQNLDRFSPIANILDTESPDIFFLAETDEKWVSKNLSIFGQHSFSHLANPGCSKLVVIGKSNVLLSIAMQDTYLSTFKDLATNTFIVAVHFPSQMYNSLDALKDFVRSVRHKMERTMGESHQSKIIIIGDFNMSPFDKAMIDFDGFSASNSRKHRLSITNLQVTRSLYFNPTWKLFQNQDFPGTKYFKRPSATSFDVIEHHYLDQVLLSHKFHTSAKDFDIAVITHLKSEIYFNSSINKVEISDHLPLKFTYKF